MKELLLGCGSRTEKDIAIGNNPNFRTSSDLTTTKTITPDILWDLTVHPLPFDNEEFDEIHAYEVLEHLATQGDYEFFFQEFSEYWRILKPQGRFYASVPIKEWTWGDPSHKKSNTARNAYFLRPRAICAGGNDFNVRLPQYL